MAEDATSDRTAGGDRPNDPVAKGDLKARLFSLNGAADLRVVQYWVSQLRSAVRGPYVPDGPPFNEVTVAKAHRECSDVQQALRELLESLSRLSATAIEAIDAPRGRAVGRSIQLLPTLLSYSYPDLRTKIEKALNNLNDPDYVQRRWLKLPGGRGRKANIRAHQIAVMLGFAYADISKSRPTLSVNSGSSIAYGPFLDLVRDTFEILNIRASAEHYARLSIAHYRENRR